MPDHSHIVKVVYLQVLLTHHAEVLDVCLRSSWKATGPRHHKCPINDGGHNRHGHDTRYAQTLRQGQPASYIILGVCLDDNSGNGIIRPPEHVPTPAKSISENLLYSRVVGCAGFRQDSHSFGPLDRQCVKIPSKPFHQSQ